VSVRSSWPFRLALRTVPQAWRASVRQDLADEAGQAWGSAWWCALEALGIALSLHWNFTRAAVMSDLRHAIRSMLHARGFALGAIATFALGIGVNVAVFSAVDRMLFRALPYDRPDGLAVLGQYRVGDAQPYGTLPAAYVVQARRLPAIVDASISTWDADHYRIARDPDGARYLSFVQVSYNLLAVLGVRPVIGHDFTERDARQKQHRLLLSYAVWQRDFAGSPSVIGQVMWDERSSGTAEIVGVLPDDFIPPQIVRPNLSWSGLSVTSDTLDAAGPNDRSTPPFVRLKAGVSLAVAQAQVDGVGQQVEAQQPTPRPGAPQTVVRLVPLRAALFGRYETYLALVFAAATLVLLAGCANLASLLLVRARSREHRTAVQLALGASTGRVIQAAVIEALLLAVSGCAVALVVLQAGNHAIAAWLPPLFSKYAAPVFATRVLVFSSALAALSAVVAGVWPGWRAARVDVLSVLQRGIGRTGTPPLRGSASMLAGEIAVSMVLVACASLTGRSLIGLLRTDVGFDMNRLQFVSAYLPSLPDLVLLRQQYGDMLDTLRTIPGVSAATGADVLPIMGAVDAPMWTGDQQQGQRWSVTDGFVETMGMRLLAGRPISASEVRTVAPVGMLSESGLRLVWPGVAPREAVGRLLEFPAEDPRQVVGVVSDVRGSYAERPWPSLYVPLGSARFRSMFYAVRMAPGRTLSVADVAHALQQRGHAPTLVRVSSVTALFDQGIVDQKFRAELFSCFGAVALLLAVIGLYAIQSFNVALRQMEFGIRISLGAEPHDLWRMLLRQTLRPVVVGVVVGIVVTYWAAQFLQALLVHVDARDLSTYAFVTAVLLAVGVLAAWLPARRAVRTDPAVVLRAQ
jgi:putative ABC transport system permease protein